MAFIRLLLAVLLASAATVSLAADPARYMTAELIAESPAPAPGRTILVGIRMKPKPGWHGYWSNPGDAGFATTVRWVAPQGVTFGPLEHPAPVLLIADGISSYVHEGEHVLISRMTVPRGLAAGTAIPVKAQLNWAACTATMCVPLNATLALDLTVGDGGKGPDWPMLRAALARLPRTAPPGTFSSDGKTIRLALPGAVRLNVRTAQFFPDDNDAFETARGHAEATSSGIIIAGPASGKLARAISGVTTDGSSAFRLNFRHEEPKAERVTQAGATRSQHVAASGENAAEPAKSEEAVSKPPAQVPARTFWPWLALVVAVAAAAVAIVRLGSAR